MPWARAAAEDATFKPRADLEAIYLTEQGLSPDDDVIAYCRIGERSSHTWFVLTHLLGFGHVRNYDGSWTEWGNTVRVPIVQGVSGGDAARAARRARRRLRRRRRRRSGCSCCSSSRRSCPRSGALRRRGRHDGAGHECQSPLFLAVEVEDAGDQAVHLFFSAPREAPTTRGFASIMSTGLDGQPAADVLAVPDDFYLALGLGQAVSPLRLRGIAAMLGRIKSQVRRNLKSV